MSTWYAKAQARNNSRRYVVETHRERTGRWIEEDRSRSLDGAIRRAEGLAYHYRSRVIDTETDSTVWECACRQPV